jgi:hypothetical protein
MINPKNFVYSAAAVARMLGVKPGMVKKVEVWFNCIFVIVAGRRPRFWKKSSFKNHFVDWRKEQAEFYDVVRTSDREFLVTNSKRSSCYHVDALQKAIVCECDDYQNQQKFFKTGCCKHGYAVLEVLGFARISEYIDHHQWVNNDDDFKEDTTDCYYYDPYEEREYC